MRRIGIPKKIIIPCAAGEIVKVRVAQERVNPKKQYKAGQALGAFIFTRSTSAFWRGLSDFVYKWTEKFKPENLGPTTGKGWHQGIG